MTRTLERFFGNKMTFSVMSAFVNQTKTYQRFSDMADDVVDVRIYQGIHFRTAGEVARRHGTPIADIAFSHCLLTAHSRDKTGSPGGACNKLRCVQYCTATLGFRIELCGLPD